MICGTIVRALHRIATRSAEYLGYLEKGQLPPARISLVTIVEEFVVDGEWVGGREGGGGPLMGIGDMDAIVETEPPSKMADQQ